MEPELNFFRGNGLGRIMIQPLAIYH